MTIRAWRIVKARHRAEAFTGEGSRLFGGRWTSRGRRAVYVSASVSLATLEILVHLENSTVLPAYVLFPVDLPEAIVMDLKQRDLPADWRAYPAPASLQLLGDTWLDSGKSAVLRVPSVIVPTEFNYLLNPEHREFGRIRLGKAGPFKFDSRLGRA